MFFEWFYVNLEIPALISSPATYTNIQLLDAVQDYRHNGELPYEKLNNGLFHALFQTLAATLI